MDEDSLYGSYLSFKDWSLSPDESGDKYFEAELESLGLHPGARIVEVGFGEGRFLDFARRAGFEICGLEIIPALIEAAVGRGHNALAGDVGDLAGMSFDLIAAFDVVEHLSVSELRKFFVDAQTALSAPGRILLRIPNGDSPFSLAHQNSDVTHRSFLNAGSIGQIAGSAGLQILEARNAARILPGGFVARLRRRMAFGLRTAIETIVGLAYFGHRVAWDANVTIVLGRRGTDLIKP